MKNCENFESDLEGKFEKSHSMFLDMSEIKILCVTFYRTVRRDSAYAKRHSSKNVVFYLIFHETQTTLQNRLCGILNVK